MNPSVKRLTRRNKIPSSSVELPSSRLILGSKNLNIKIPTVTMMAMMIF
jgi:hypothetical protein